MKQGVYNDALQSFFGVVGGLFLVDLVSGITHIVLDFYPLDPVLSHSLCECKTAEDAEQAVRSSGVSKMMQTAAMFQLHHRYPAGITKRPMEEIVTLPLVYGGVLASGVVAKVFGLAGILQSQFALCMLVTVIVFAPMVQLSHSNAHGRKLPWYLAKLALPGIMCLDARAHALHHRGNHAVNFSILNGWSNPMLNAAARLGFKLSLQLCVGIASACALVTHSEPVGYVAIFLALLYFTGDTIKVALRVRGFLRAFLMLHHAAALFTIVGALLSKARGSVSLRSYEVVFKLLLLEIFTVLDTINVGEPGSAIRTVRIASSVLFRLVCVPIAVAQAYGGFQGGAMQRLVRMVAVAICVFQPVWLATSRSNSVRYHVRYPLSHAGVPETKGDP